MSIKAEPRKIRKLDATDNDKTYVCFGFGCLNIGILIENLNGCSMSNECCCCLHEFCFLTQGSYLGCLDKSVGEHVRVGCGCDALTLKKPVICFKQQCHCLCLICGCSLIPDKEVPCIFACCSIVYSTMKCNVLCQNCQTFGEIAIE